MLFVPLTWLLLSWMLHRKRASRWLVLFFSLCVDCMLQFPFGVSALLCGGVNFLIPFTFGSRWMQLTGLLTIGLLFGVIYELLHGSFGLPVIAFSALMYSVVYYSGTRVTIPREIGHVQQ